MGGEEAISYAANSMNQLVTSHPACVKGTAMPDEASGVRLMRLLAAQALPG